MSAGGVAGRLVFEPDGNMLVAYFAQPGTMDGALVVGSIHLAAIANPAAKQTFIDLIAGFITAGLEARSGEPAFVRPAAVQ